MLPESNTSLFEDAGGGEEAEAVPDDYEDEYTSADFPDEEEHLVEIDRDEIAGQVADDVVTWLNVNRDIVADTLAGAYEDEDTEDEAHDEEPDGAEDHTEAYTTQYEADAIYVMAEYIPQILGIQVLIFAFMVFRFMHKLLYDLIGRNLV